MVFNDKVFDNQTRLLMFDLFNTDGILGDKVPGQRKNPAWFPRKSTPVSLPLAKNRSALLGSTRCSSWDRTTATKQFWQISTDGCQTPAVIQSR